MATFKHDFDISWNTVDSIWKKYVYLVSVFTPQPLMPVGVLFSPMVSGWSGGRPSGRAAGNSLSRLYLRNRKV